MSSVQPQDKYVLRLPNGMRDRLKAAAKVDGRSMNEAIVRALEAAYPAPNPSSALNEARLLRAKAAAFTREAEALLRALEERAQRNTKGSA